MQEWSTLLLPNGDVEPGALKRQRQSEKAVGRAFVDHHAIHVSVEAVRTNKNSSSVDASTADVRFLYDAQVLMFHRRVIEVAEQTGYVV